MVQPPTAARQNQCVRCGGAKLGCASGWRTIAAPWLTVAASVPESGLQPPGNHPLNSRSPRGLSW